MEGDNGVIYEKKHLKYVLDVGHLSEAAMLFLLAVGVTLINSSGNVFGRAFGALFVLSGTTLFLLSLKEVKFLAYKEGGIRLAKEEQDLIPARWVLTAASIVTLLYILTTAKG